MKNKRHKPDNKWVRLLKSGKKPRKYFRFMRKLNRQNQREFELQVMGATKIKASKPIEHFVTPMPIQ